MNTQWGPVVNGTKIPIFDMKKEARGFGKTKKEAKELHKDHTQCQVCGIFKGQTKNKKMFKCNACKCAFYCCRAHQKQDWKHHKTFCKNMKKKSISPMELWANSLRLYDTVVSDKNDETFMDKYNMISEYKCSTWSVKLNYKKGYCHIEPMNLMIFEEMGLTRFGEEWNSKHKNLIEKGAMIYCVVEEGQPIQHGGVTVAISSEKKKDYLEKVEM